MKEDLFDKTFNELMGIEEYHFGTTDDDGYSNFDDYTEYPFADSEGMQILSSEYNKLKLELQQYKQQIDELKEYVNSKHFSGNFQSDNKKHILQILKESER